MAQAPVLCSLPRRSRRIRSPSHERRIALAAQPARDGVSPMTATRRRSPARDRGSRHVGMAIGHGALGIRRITHGGEALRETPTSDRRLHAYRVCLRHHSHKSGCDASQGSASLRLDADVRGSSGPSPTRASGRRRGGAAVRAGAESGAPVVRSSSLAIRRSSSAAREKAVYLAEDAPLASESEAQLQTMCSLKVVSRLRS